MDTHTLEELVDSLAEALAADESGLVSAYSHEPAPEEIDLIYTPPPEPARTAAATPEPSVAQPDSFAPERTGLPANFRCTLCSDRMYPVKRYYRSGRLPVLVLLHNGLLAPGPARLDRSEQFVFGSRAEDELFERMVSAVGKTPGDFHFQEYTACHFNADRSLPEDWNERGRNCLTHLNDTIVRENIRLLLVTGPAAVLLLGEEKAHAMATGGEGIHLPLGDGEIPAMAIRSPAALLALENKRRRAGEQGNESAYKQIVRQEKDIKKSIVSALRQALQAVE